MSRRSPKLLVLYHFFHPDQVVSARIFSDFAEEQTRRGWQVSALTTNRAHSGTPERYVSEEWWNGVHITRTYRPAWPQTNPVFRLGNTAWTLSAWFLEFLRMERFDAIVIGSDPSFAAAIAIPLRAVAPRAPILHWCLDVFPDAGEAEWTGATRLLSPIARRLMSAAYRRCDAVVDLGPCMRRRLERYGGAPYRETLTPWALVEPAVPSEPDPATRREIFGDAKIALIYAGSMSRSHDYVSLLHLARACRARAGNEIVLNFACTGTNLPALKAAVKPDDTNVRFTAFTDEASLQRRLEAADYHVGSLRPEFTGVVVPSKFFAALAVARPFIFAGAADAAIAGWIREHDVGLVLGSGGVDAAADKLVALKDNPAGIRSGRAAAFEAYHHAFSKRVINDRWAELLQRFVRL